MPTEIIVAAIAAVATITVAVVEAIAARNRKKDKEDNEKYRAYREEKEAAHEELLLHLVEGVGAAIALGEATAHALQRGHTNGDTEAALRYAAEVKHKQKDFLAKRGVHSIVD